MIPKAFIEIILQRTDIITLIGGYIDLAERGQNFVGLCPFDSGNNKPTFTVSSTKQVWKCFKCGKGGNAIKFVEQIEKTSFPEAISILARKLNLAIPNSE